MTQEGSIEETGSAAVIMSTLRAAKFVVSVKNRSSVPHKRPTSRSLMTDVSYSKGIMK